MRLERIIQRSLRRTLARDARNTAPVTLLYDDGTVPDDRNDEEAYADGTPAAAELKALVHFISAADVVAKGLLEVEASDIILDFDPAVSFAGMNNLRFVVDGRCYVQRHVGKEAMRYFDLIVNDVRMFRTVVGMRVRDWPAADGFVRYVSGLENIALYAYRNATKTYAPLAATAGRAVIAAGFDGQNVFSIKFGGTPALSVDALGTLRVGRVTALGASASPGLPRLEFWFGPNRYASLSADGELAVPRFEASAENPGIAADFEFRGPTGQWLASLDASGAYAPAVGASQ